MTDHYKTKKSRGFLIILIFSAILNIILLTSSIHYHHKYDITRERHHHCTGDLANALLQKGEIIRKYNDLINQIEQAQQTAAQQSNINDLRNVLRSLLGIN